ncbi:LysR family transcriptional regulator [Lichenibacterium minor]|uniref:LysR family transcriptional regulator n=1 Tax=Lichenibacterium minor TaxID=2316528 RepID=A0A4Q2U408_9HYPH|nr:LysR family transcriptional regulator [Lichenibacterium minor]RYC29691.1 LysR family transcriptional regulator [Lichenibacterium minor]
MPRNLDMALLRAFTAVADHRSMTVAAQALHLTQGAVSQQIARLEALAGGPLLARERPGLRLTPAGERLLGNARRLVALNDEVWTDLEGGALAGPVRLGVPHDLLGCWFTPMLKRYAEACPNVELSLRTGASVDLTRDLAAGRLDLALVEAPLGGEVGELLAVDRLVWVGAQGGVAHHRTPLPVSIVADVCVFKPAVLTALEGREGGWRTVFEDGGLEATFATVRADLAVSAWLATTVPSDLDVLPPASGLPDLPTFAITLHGAGHPATPAVDEFVRYIRDHFNQLA